MSSSSQDIERNCGKMMCNNPKLDHVYINAHTKFGLILYKSSEDNERERKIMTDERTNGQTDGRTNGMTDNPNPI